MVKSVDELDTLLENGEISVETYGRTLKTVLLNEAEAAGFSTDTILEHTKALGKMESFA
jgi:hypothetical protein